MNTIQPFRLNFKTKFIQFNHQKVTLHTCGVGSIVPCASVGKPKQAEPTGKFLKDGSTFSYERYYLLRTDLNFKYFGKKSQSPTMLGIKFSFDAQHFPQGI